MTSVVVNQYFDWGADRAPGIPYYETVIYEAHVKGMTRIHPDVPEALRGTYAGLTHLAIIEHLKSLHVTTIELMPVHQFVHDDWLVQRGLRNYWGYNSVGFFAPHKDYAAATAPGAAVTEFKAMVRAFHEANIEVILDVAMSCTAEGNESGPTISLRGVDNAAYYRLAEEDRRRYLHYGGTGNSLNMRHPRALQMIMDSLRYWATEMHVDGFRFNETLTLRQEFAGSAQRSPFLTLLNQDPVLRGLKLVGEPRDEHQTRSRDDIFPRSWAEWNCVYRNTVRDYWRGEPMTCGEFVTRLTGSGDLYGPDHSRARLSINYVTSHEGFTLRDLVSYGNKHNEANGQSNSDGETDNRSWNSGTEGDADTEVTRALRRRQVRNLLTTLAVSNGVPMLSHGDELGRTQAGNNNAYCQDNPVSWVDWEAADEDLVGFVSRLFEFRAQHPVLRRRFGPFPGRPDGGNEPVIPDLEVLGPDAAPVDMKSRTAAATFALFLNGKPFTDGIHSGGHIDDDDLLIIFNRSAEEVVFTLPEARFGAAWRMLLTTADADDSFDSADPTPAGSTMALPSRSVTVFIAIDVFAQ
jgi:glycogen operon protein